MNAAEAALGTFRLNPPHSGEEIVRRWLWQSSLDFSPRACAETWAEAQTTLAVAFHRSWKLSGGIVLGSVVGVAFIVGSGLTRAATTVPQN
jgi:predicted oxidoreductase